MTSAGWYARGPRGSSISAGSGAPSGGNDGDLYVRTSNGDLYAKASGTWSVVGNIRGPGGTTPTLTDLGITADATELNYVDGVTSSIQTQLNGKQAALGFTPENAAKKGVANGYASLDGSGTVPAAQLPSYVDDVLEYVNLAGFPGTGETGKIYVALDTNKTYRWSGSGYIEISPSPGSTDAVAEGSVNKYYTDARVDARMPGAVHAAASKATPVDADELDLVDSAASWGLKKLTWANLKAAVKTYLDGTGIAKLTTPRTINGVSFDGTANITVVDSTKEPAIAAGTSAQYWRGDKTMATLDKTAVGLGNVTNNAQYYPGGTDVAVADGGTGASTASAARSNLGLGSLATVTPTGTADNTTVLYGDNVYRVPPTGGGGTGDVVGPAASVDTEVAVFSGTTGKSIKRATTTGLAKLSSGVLSAAVAGTDYQRPTVVNVKDPAYGAVGDDTADDTTALNNAKAVAVAAGLPLYIPKGTYKVTGTLDWMVNDLVVIGDGSRLSQIRQSTSNVPVVKVAGQHQKISGLGFRYTSQQTSAQTSAIGLAFGDDTVGSCFASEFRDLRFVNCAIAMAMNPAITTVAGLFSCMFFGIDIPTYSISAISLTGGNDVGAYATGCVFQNVYINNASDGTTCSSYAVLLRDWDEVVFNQLNIEHGTVNTADVFALIRVNNLVVNDLHFEKITASSDGAALLYLSNSRAVINSGTARFNTFSGSASNPVFRMFGTSKLVVNNWVDNSNTVTTPSRPVIDFGSAANSSALINHMDLGQVTVRRTGGDSTDRAVFHDEALGKAPRIGSTASSATPSISCDSYEQYNITALAAAITSVTITGTPTDGQKLLLRIKDNGTARALAFGSGIVASGAAALPTTTVAGKTHHIGLTYDAAAAKWVALAVDSTGY